jgi:hypothetical protein
MCLAGWAFKCCCHCSVLQHESAVLQAAADAAEAEHVAREAQYAAQLAVAAAKAADLQARQPFQHEVTATLPAKHGWLHLYAPHTYACRLRHADITVDMQAELARSEKRRTVLEEIARQGLIATNPSEYSESAEAQQWRSMQRETMWLRAKICVLAHFCKVLRQRLYAAEQRHADVAHTAQWIWLLLSSFWAAVACQTQRTLYMSSQPTK